MFYFFTIGTPVEIIKLQSETDPTDLKFISYSQALDFGLIRMRPSKEFVASAYKPNVTCKANDPFF